MPKLKDVIGHQRQLQELEKDVESGNISHAYLFAGPRHIGKMTTALWFAEKILTKGLSEEQKAEAWRRIERLTHPDLLVLDQLWIEKEMEDWDAIAKSSNVPQVHRSKKSASAKTDTIGIDDVRALQQRLHETSYGSRSCCLIRSVERMQDAAANALLKILEEPPAGLTFLLTTQAASSLLPTIISRARVLRFQPLPLPDMRRFVSAADEEDGSFILRLAQGAPGIAERLAREPDALRQAKQQYNASVTFWETASLHRRLQVLQPLRQRGDEADEMLLHLALALRRQPPAFRQKNTGAFLQLLRGLKTNANPQLLSQAFALQIEEK